MKKIMPSFEYEPLVLSLKPKNSDEKKTEEIQMGRDHQIHEFQRSQETSTNERIALQGRILNRL
jgi:hypothetical protein